MLAQEMIPLQFTIFACEMKIQVIIFFLIPEISEDLNNQSELAGFFLNFRRVSDYILFTIVASPEY